MDKLILPAGEYYIGDPCYVIDDALWGEFCNLSFTVGEQGVFEFRGHKCFISSTNYGDGTYYDQMTRAYPVDAGIIGAIPWTLVAKEHKGCGHKFDTTREFEVGAAQDQAQDEKVIYIGAVVIRT